MRLIRADGMMATVTKHMICAALWLMVVAPVAADDAELARCAAIADHAERLRCYDALAHGAKREDPPAEPKAAASPLSERLRRERESRKLLLTPLRPTYILQTYNRSPNEAPIQIVEPGAHLQSAELKFQFSFRVRLVDDLLGDNGDLWFGYTQLSFWQSYNSVLSSPFRETNYEPELGFSVNTDFDLFGFRNRVFSFGFAHQSNGRTEPLSRSWNRIWAAFLLERGNFAVLLRPWYRVPEDTDDDDNPGIENYAGRGELRVAYKSGNYVYSAMLHNNFRLHDNRSGVELHWTFPAGKRLKGMLQYYTGYSESLIDYDVRTRRFGIGLLIADWL